MSSTGLYINTGRATTTYKDADIKHILGKHKNDVELRKLLAPAKPDAVYGNVSNLYIIEYENSSRGMSYHILKYASIAIRRPDIIFKVLIIQTLHHQLVHKGDFYNIQAAKYLDIPNLVFYIESSRSEVRLKKLIVKFASVGVP